MKPRHAAALAPVRVGIVILSAAIPAGALLLPYFGPINGFRHALRWLVWLPNIPLEILFNRWMTVENKLFWLVVLSAFPVIVWAVAGLLVARRIRSDPT
jgi:hypothetical protein